MISLQVITAVPIKTLFYTLVEVVRKVQQMPPLMLSESSVDVCACKETVWTPPGAFGFTIRYDACQVRNRPCERRVYFVPLVLFCFSAHGLRRFGQPHQRATSCLRTSGLHHLKNH
eukprot:4780206-Amphidinium_carterae.1